MLNIEGPFVARGHNVYRHVKIHDGEEEFGDASVEAIESWIAVCADDASARGVAEAMNVRFACDWEYGVSAGDGSKSAVSHRRRMAFHTDWEDVPYDELPEMIKEHFSRPER